MKIVVATPLYPPDIALPAPYVKELAKRLTVHAPSDLLSIVTYGHLPEKVNGVRIVTVSKRQPLLFRLIAYTFALWKEARHADVLFVQNGASVELPVAIVSLFRRVRIVFNISDEVAHAHAARSKVYGMIERFTMARAKKVVTGAPAARPEILPFLPYPTEAFATYEASWNTHLQELNTAFTHD